MAADKTYTVYIHKFPNGKVYVGASRQKPIRKRWRNGQGYRNQKLVSSAIKEFGWDNIEHIIVGEELEESDAQNLERELISKYNAQDPEHGYNTKNGGQVFGDHSEGFLENLQNRMLGNKYCVGRKLSKSHIEALVNSRKGVSIPSKRKGIHDMPEEMKQYLSEKAKERWRDPETRKKYMDNLRDMSGKNNPRYGVKLSEETKEKIRQKAIGRKASDETRRKLSERSRKAVVQYDLNMNELARFESCKEAGESVDGNGTNVAFCCKNPKRTYKKCFWRYLSEEGDE